MRLSSCSLTAPILAWSATLPTPAAAEEPQGERAAAEVSVGTAPVSSASPETASPEAASREDRGTAVATTPAVVEGGVGLDSPPAPGDVSQNPYDDPQLPWRTASQPHEQHASSASPAPAPAPLVSGTFEERPSIAPRDTGHVVPTVGWTEKAAGPAPPFSVGGVTAELGPDTWFKFYGFLQTRYVTGEHQSPEDGSVFGGGFNLPRVRLFFYGRLTDWLRVLVRLGATGNGTASFEQAFADFRYKAFTLRIGQFYLPAFQEQAPSAVALLPLNYSAVGAVFDGGQTQGAKLTFDLQPTRLHFFVTDGFRTGFSEAGSPSKADVAVSVRAETVVGGGDYGQFDTGSSFRGDGASLLLGAGLHYQSGGALAEDAVQMGSSNVDATFEWNGASVHCSAALMNTADAMGARIWNGGVVFQGGLMVLPWTEVYGRYEALLTTPSATSEQIVFRGVTAGVNHYVWPERGIRATADFVYYFDPTVGTAITPNPNAGLFESSGSQWSARAQFNILF